MLVIVMLAAFALVVNGISYVRSPDYRLRRWTREWGIQHYAAFAHAEAAGVRVRPVDGFEINKFRRIAFIRAIAQPALLTVVGLALRSWGTPLWANALILGTLLLPQISPHVAVRQVSRGVQSGHGAAAVRAAVYLICGLCLLFGGVAALWWAVEVADAHGLVWQLVLPLLSGLGTKIVTWLWGGYAVFAPEFQVFFAGDTGYSKDFADIHARFAARHGAGRLC